MTLTQHTGLALLEALDLPVVNNQVSWDVLSGDELHLVIQGIIQHLDAREPDEPTDGVLDRSVQLEDTVRAIAPLQHRYAGLLEDAFNSPKLRATIGLDKGKTPFRDAKDLVAKTHGLRAFEATGRLKLARNLTPARASDPERDESVAVGATKYPLLGAMQAQGHIHPSKLSTAVNMLADLDDNALTAGKDQAFRDRLREVVEKDLVDKIEHTTPEEFSRYVSRRKADLIAAMDPPDQQFTSAQTEAMHTLRCDGPVRGNPNAHKWTLITDAEGNEALHFIAALANNPRAKTKENDTDETDSTDTTEATSSDDNQIVDRRTRGQRAMHALRDAVKFAIARLEETELPGTNGRHTQLVVLADYPTLLQHVQDQLAYLLPELSAQRREKLLRIIADAYQTDANQHAEARPANTSAANSNNDINDEKVRPSAEPASEDTSVITFPTKVPPGLPPPDRARPDPDIEKENGPMIPMPLPKTTDVEELFEGENLDRLQPRIAQGIYTQYYPPEILLRLLCDVSVSPVTLTGDREVLSVGRKQRQFPDAIRRAILARDRGCAVPGCHWPAAWCELHHVQPWADHGATSVDNGLTLCAHHHQTLHAKALRIQRIDGVFHFIQHPSIDPTQQPRSNHFWQN